MTLRATILPTMTSATAHPALPQLGRPMTFEEWAAMDEDEPGELVDGRLEALCAFLPTL